MIADRLHLAPDGIHLACVDLEEGLAVVRSEAVLEYTGCGTRAVNVLVQLLDREGNVAAQDSMPVTVQEHTKNTYRQKLYVKNPSLWNVDAPYLYSYRICIMEGENMLDEECGSFGIRKLQLDTAHGLRINGKTVKLRGGSVSIMTMA